MFEVNGLIYDELPEVLDANDEILVLVPFEDAECNLACGTYGQSFHIEGTGDTLQQSTGGAGSLLGGAVPCGTEASGVYLGLYAPGSDGYPGHYEFRLGVTDACGAPSTGEHIAGMFDVL